MDKLAHIYLGRNYGNCTIQLACTKNWVPSKSIGNVFKIREMEFWNHKYYEINGVKQWSQGAGHNATCEICLLFYGKRIGNKVQKLMNQFELIIEAKNKEIESLKKK